MAYTGENFKSKAALKRALKGGKRVTVFQPGPFGPHVADGNVALEGPHYPAAHTWYGSAMVKDGAVVSVK